MALPAIARRLAALLPESRSTDGEAPLELTSEAAQPPRLVDAQVIEGGELAAKRVFDAPLVGFAAFLDGTQETRVACYLAGGVPIVTGTIGAVVRERRNLRMFTWRHTIERRVYAPRALIDGDAWTRLASSELSVVDSTELDDARDAVAAHPLALRETAVHRVQRDREAAEEALAVDWAARDARPILIDGGLSGSERVARSECACGVVKSHRSLYARGDALAAVLSLEQGWRSSAFLITSPKRAPVASWYLRIRDPRGHDPMWGLVRVEVAAPKAGAEREIGARADVVSRWILAEATPLSLPDARWDKMVYGVRDCEQFLRATR
jgi:hypothetical protein